MADVILRNKYGELKQESKQELKWLPVKNT